MAEDSSGSPRTPALARLSGLFHLFQPLLGVCDPPQFGGKREALVVPVVCFIPRLCAALILAPQLGVFAALHLRTCPAGSFSLTFPLGGAYSVYKYGTCGIGKRAGYGHSPLRFSFRIFFHFHALLKLKNRSIRCQDSMGIVFVSSQIYHNRHIPALSIQFHRRRNSHRCFSPAFVVIMPANLNTALYYIGGCNKSCFFSRSIRVLHRFSYCFLAYIHFAESSPVYILRSCIQLIDSPFRRFWFAS